MECFSPNQLMNTDVKSFLSQYTFDNIFDKLSNNINDSFEEISFQSNKPKFKDMAIYEYCSKIAGFLLIDYDFFKDVHLKVKFNDSLCESLMKNMGYQIENDICILTEKPDDNELEKIILRHLYHNRILQKGDYLNSPVRNENRISRNHSGPSRVSQESCPENEPLNGVQSNPENESSNEVQSLPLDNQESHEKPLDSPIEEDLNMGDNNNILDLPDVPEDSDKLETIVDYLEQHEDLKPNNDSENQIISDTIGTIDNLKLTLDIPKSINHDSITEKQDIESKEHNSLIKEFEDSYERRSSIDNTIIHGCNKSYPLDYTIIEPSQLNQISREIIKDHYQLHKRHNILIPLIYPDLTEYQINLSRQNSGDIYFKSWTCEKCDQINCGGYKCTKCSQENLVRKQSLEPNIKLDNLLLDQIIYNNQSSWLCKKCFYNNVNGYTCLQCNEMDKEQKEEFDKINTYYECRCCEQLSLINKQCNKCNIKLPNIQLYICKKCNAKNSIKNIKCLECDEIIDKTIVINCKKCQKNKVNKQLYGSICIDCCIKQYGKWNCIKCQFINPKMDRNCLKCGAKKNE